MQEYEPADEASPVLVHIDAYRLRGGEGMSTIGWEGEGAEIRRGAVVAVEWAELVSEALGADRLMVELVHAGEGREIRLSPTGAWVDRMPAIREAVGV